MKTKTDNVVAFWVAHHNSSCKCCEQHHLIWRGIRARAITIICKEMHLAPCCYSNFSCSKVIYCAQHIPCNYRSLNNLPSLQRERTEVLQFLVASMRLCTYFIIRTFQCSILWNSIVNLLLHITRNKHVTRAFVNTYYVPMIYIINIATK